MQQPVLYLMLGYPGSGKTTASRAIHEITGAVHLWADKIRNERYPHPTHSHEENLELYTHLNELTAELLATGQSVVFDTAFNFYKDRQHLRKIAEEHGASALLLWVQTGKELARERATHPDHAARNTYPHAMPLERFERITSDFEPPRPNEAYISVDGTKITPTYIRQLLDGAYEAP
jgi:predicted kinase